jgi:hypothetical protein
VVCESEEGEEVANSVREDKIEEQGIIQTQNEFCQEAQMSNAPSLRFFLVIFNIFIVMLVFSLLSIILSLLQHLPCVW